VAAVQHAFTHKQYTFTHKQYTFTHKQYTFTHKQHTFTHKQYTEYTGRNLYENKIKKIKIKKVNKKSKCAILVEGKTDFLNHRTMVS
jgi:hypothetical protein